jgi:siroheme synthase-like protein
VVVGAGRIAARKVASLLEAGADVVVVAPEAGPDVTEWAGAGRIRWERREFRPADLDGVWLGFSATSSADVNRAVLEAGEARRVWVNAADDPAHCSFTLMSLVRQGDLTIAIGTNGRSPALAAYLKDRIRGEIGPEYETLLEMLADEREAMRAAGRSSEDADWRAALDSGILELVRTGREAEAREQLRSCL